MFYGYCTVIYLILRDWDVCCIQGYRMYIKLFVKEDRMEKFKENMIILCYIKELQLKMTFDLKKERNMKKV